MKKGKKKDLLPVYIVAVCTAVVLVAARRPLARKDCRELSQVKAKLFHAG